MCESHLNVSFQCSSKIKSEVVGFVQLYPTFSTVSLKTAYIVTDLYVKPSVRQKGVAHPLIECYYQYCKENSARYVTLETSVAN
ncbi:GNAT family N-acetyltransferase [Priestia flexa]|uniref:GNAT family N-acetyltransferase n=1 Tax=Priestia flexa TaxID=86664 RepID=UPI001B326509